MDIVNNIFKKSIPNYNKLENYGFIKENNKYIYYKDFYNNEFKLVFIIDNNISIKIIDNNIEEEYIAINNNSRYANEVKNELLIILNNIKDNCFITNYFVYSQTNRIVNLIYKKYKDKPEFLWKDADYGVFRNKNSNKWYGIIMNLENIKSLDYPHDIEIINIKLDRDKITKLLNKKGFYKAYHMSKIDWISISLNDTLKDIDIMNLIDQSYNLVDKKRKNDKHE